MNYATTFCTKKTRHPEVEINSKLVGFIVGSSPIFTSPNSSLPLGFSNKFLYAVISPVHATFPDHLCLPAFNALIMVEYTL